MDLKRLKTKTQILDFNSKHFSFCRVKANKIKDYVAKETRRINIAYLEIDSNPSSPRFRSHTYEDIDDYIDMSAVYEGGSISSYYEHMENVYEQPIPIVK